jgi:hypothetical protein
MCAMSLERETVREKCSHPDAEMIGSDANAEFMRCRLCSQIFVRQSGRIWAIRSSRPSAMWIR